MARTGVHHHSEATKAAVIAAIEAGMGVTEAAETYGVPQPTVSRWMRMDHTLLNPLVDLSKKSLADKAEAVAHLLIDAAPGKIQDATLTGTMTSFGIGVDKMQLLRNKPTAIMESFTSVEERDAKAAELIEKVKLRMVAGGG